MTLSIDRPKLLLVEKYMDPISLDCVIGIWGANIKTYQFFLPLNHCNNILFE